MCSPRPGAYHFPARSPRLSLPAPNGFEPQRLAAWLGLYGWEIGTLVSVGFDLANGTVYESRRETETQFDVVYLDRWRRRGYRAAAPVVAELLDQVKQETGLPAVVLVDHTGVDIAVLEDLRAAGLQCTGITFTGGSTVNRRGRNYLVPKGEIVSNLMVLVENRRIHVPAALPLANIFEGEMQNLAGDEWREGAHDDVVFSVAMTAWFAVEGTVSIHPPGAASLGRQWTGKRPPRKEKPRYFDDPTKRGDHA